MKKFRKDGSVVEFALFAKNPSGKSVLVATDFDCLDLDDDQERYVRDAIGDAYDVYTEEM